MPAYPYERRKSPAGTPTLGQPPSNGAAKTTTATLPTSSWPSSPAVDQVVPRLGALADPSAPRWHIGAYGESLYRDTSVRVVGLPSRVDRTSGPDQRVL